MKKLRQWLVSRFLPVLAREALEAENRRLRAKVLALEEKNARLSAYLDGLETGIRAQKKIVIYGKEAVK